MLTPASALRKDSIIGAELQHRHFAFIAQTIKAIPDHPQFRSYLREHAAKTFADACARTNPRFDRARFLRACGMEG